MEMSGNMDDMGMNMSLQQMDMNAVMYPELSADKMHKEHKMDMENGESSNAIHSMKKISSLNYSMLKSPTKTVLPSHAPVRELHFELTGNMNRYVWSMDNKVLSEVDKILIKKGEIVRITLYNNSMMRHPMHLHGHDFRVIT